MNDTQTTAPSTTAPTGDQQRAALMRLADPDLPQNDVNDDIETFLPFVLPHLNRGARWAHVEGMRLLARRIVGLKCGEVDPGLHTPTRRGEPRDMHADREIVACHNKMCALMEAAIRADFNAAMSSTPDLMSPYPAPRLARANS